MPANEKYAVDLHEIEASESLIGQVDCRAGLRSGVTISSVQAISSDPTGLTLSSAAVNGSSITVNGATVTAGLGLTFLVAPGTTTIGVTYTIKIRCVLSTSEVKTFNCYMTRR